MTQFSEKVALVTGGASGIGAATARLLAQRGATVFIGDLPGGNGEAIATEVGGTFLALNVTSEADWSHAVQTILDRQERLDVLVNAAGIVGDVVNGTIANTTLAEFRRVMSVNLDGTFLGCKEALAAMQKHGIGAIINLASVGAYYPTTQSVAYGASKGAVTQLTKTVALTGAENGNRIRCNSVHPGKTATPMLETIFDQYRQRQAAGGTDPRPTGRRIPLGDEGTAADVAHLITFLASDEAGYITGGEFTVDGGWRLLR
ncbi:SDR family NAD(P)-dependent oxidoreductase [Cupriavidus pauculus]|uniref:SDR family NAD(P)-dependent oxidoreductase n=1 Tax=Cupriavidus pauculus TaxID=82633 RepID=UPI001EE229DF|nr:SDR family oxidoreductase [Cupriavidus pauculus]GJG94306.1 SDR family oxidoreductase [Cupriavidus pauculus]